MNKRRIFIAINLPDGIKKKLIDWQRKCLPAEALAKAGDKINWVRKENLHITLIFIGYVTDDETYEICKMTKEVAKKHQPFFINLERITTGPLNEFPRMFWVIGEKSQELANLQNDLENNQVKAFRPHITLARFKNQVAKDLPKIDDAFIVSVPVERIDVMQSNLKRGGPEYTILESINLEGNEPR
ncbi:MAG TPA: RNA 2',3'-cyclic phosphodiesterase [Candidatus Paceibacterota bacterium]|nr:RNA 2',3'-cyclic phosphodiesterase [Candidatus Paceibacterota bacterium]